MSKYIDYLVPINNVCNQKCNFYSAEYRMEGNKLISMKNIFKQILEKFNIKLYNVNYPCHIE